MAREVTGVKFNGNPDKKVKKNHKNKVHIDGHELHPGSKKLKIEKMRSDMDDGSTLTWTVDKSTINVDEDGEFIDFDSFLPKTVVARGKPFTNGDTGDITITLEYENETDLDAPCEDVEHEP
jgi:hypothetical protein